MRAYLAGGVSWPVRAGVGFQKGVLRVSARVTFSFPAKGTDPRIASGCGAPTGGGGLAGARRPTASRGWPSLLARRDAPRLARRRLGSEGVQDQGAGE